MDEEINLSHLDEDHRSDALLSATERIRIIGEDKWVPYPLADELLTRFETLLAAPQTIRPDNYLIVAPSRNGKTSLLAEFLRRHRASEALDADTSFVPVLRVETPSKPDEARLYTEIMDQLNAPYRPSFSADEKRSLAWNALRKVRTRLILLDELHDARHGSDNKCMEFLSVLKKINNVLQISIIAAGTEQAEEFLKQDEQVDNRFQKFPLHLWQPNPEFARFVLSFEKALPLRKPSKLKDKAILGYIFKRSGGRVGGIISLIRSAARYAVSTGIEYIDMEALEKCDFQDAGIYANAELRKRHRKG